jgi:short-subunit dehydrogenase
MEIAGSVALVTGASSGIGRAVAVDLAKRGATVVVSARRAPELEETAEMCRRFAPASFAVTADVGSAEDCARLVGAAVERLQAVDIVVNNAGVSMHKHVLDTSPQDVAWILSVNFLGAVNITAPLLAGMVERGRGSIVSVTSVAAYLPNPKESAYGAAKAALHLWTHGLNVDLAGSGVHAGVLSPGPIDTEIWGKDETPSSYAGKKYPPEVVATGVARMIDKELAHLTVPRRFGAVGPLYTLPLIHRLVRKGLIRFEETGQKKAASRSPKHG